ncbi:glycosyltransferase [Isachenkonia alkalipeptolytica]|uniref:Glycosyltransferase family 1 protein n=1 Tax=Isachenkonia alkalipeptolytica TaxID=2565777 RepID=A0AA43XMF0_9CLOT|nr:glycosyltransferase [Isachenkonia alkalipeptolytica]NBG88625.1 glycosyltransferase family 1 protein [Isachenkonia alkalipeptolytica]
MTSAKKRIIILSPPFYSHFHPLKTLGKALKAQGAQVGVACSEGFRREIEAAGLRFYPLNINTNQNTGIAKNTDQDREEKKRLEEFFEATYHGPVKTLITQGEHRIRDMFSNPGELIHALRKLQETQEGDLFIVDQLSYGATLALIGLEIPFITFCPPHPATIQSKEGVNGLTEHWPAVLEPSEEEKRELKNKQEEVNQRFRKAFTEVFHHHFPHREIPGGFFESPFSLTSPRGVLFNYPSFPDDGHSKGKERERGVPAYYLHYCFEPEELKEPLRSRVKKEPGRKVLISFGTFLSERRDVIERLMEGFLDQEDDWHIYVAVGGNSEFFNRFDSRRVTKASFLPQKALMPHMDLVVHHGGANSFTETLYYGKPMMILPFSSDQFAVAFDAQENKIGAVLDPNHITKEAFDAAMEKLRSREVNQALQFWREKAVEKGPRKGARWILELMS